MIGKIVGGCIGLVVGFIGTLPLMVDNIGSIQKYSGEFLAGIWTASTLIGVSVAHHVENPGSDDIPTV